MGKEKASSYKVSAGSPLHHPWDEHACVQGCVKQDLRYQEVLYKRFYNEMRMMINRYTKDYDEGTSILNNGFLRVFKKIHLYKHQGQLQAWIKQIMVHAISDYFRYKHQPANIALEYAENTEQHSTSINLAYDYNLLLKTLDELPRTTRLVVNLFIIEGYAHKEIAQLLGISEGTSKWHLSEGRKLLSHHLNHYR